tara:strand:- start:10701 stop:13139 length:2439 start_codon:yes stop_codon:yes gene_type:complete
MAIEKQNQPQADNEQPIEIEIDQPQQEIPEDLEVLIKEIGDLDVEEFGMDNVTFGDNLAENIDEDSLNSLCSTLSEHYQEDYDSREDWYNAFTQGLELLGIKYDQERTQPFQGASGVHHPLLAEAVTQFQAQAYKELLPAGGPVNTQVVGDMDSEMAKQAERVRDFMNYQIMHVMEEYDPDMDQLLFYLPLSGSAFKKVYFDPSMARACSKFIMAEDLVVPYYATDLMTSPRVTHVIKMPYNDLRKLQVNGFYKDVELSDPNYEADEVEEKMEEIQGISPINEDEEYTLLEMHVNLDLMGFEDIDDEGNPTGIALPYIVTFVSETNTILSIRKNFRPDDPLKRKIQHFVHYKFLPGLGFYGFGLIHMIGGLSQSATSILRQLIDAGTLSNLPAGFKARGMNVSKLDEPLQPGEFRDVDIPGGTLRDAIMPLPYKEPSGTLAQLLGVLVDSGRRFASIADMQVGDSNQQAPVGTTIALLERGSKVMSAIHKRLHYAQKLEFKILARVFSESIPDEYPFDVAGASRSVFVKDFDQKVDVIPVSDPNIFSTSQRITMAQTQLQLAQSAPGIHNLREAYKNMYIALDVKNLDDILKPEEQQFPKDPVTENQEVLMGTPLKAFIDQDHDAHIAAHTAFLQNPNVQSNQQAVAALQAHIQEHFALKYRLEVMQLMAQQGVQLPPEGQPLPMEVQNAIAQQAVQATQQITGKDQAIQQAQLNAQIDPQMQMFQAQMQLEQAKLQLRQAEAQLRAQTDIERANIQAETDEKRIQSEEKRQDARLAVNLQQDLLEKEEQSLKDIVELAKEAQKARNLPENN